MHTLFFFLEFAKNGDTVLLHLVVAVSSVHAGYVLKRKTKNQEKIEAKRGEHVHRDKIEPKRERTKQLNIRLN